MRYALVGYGRMGRAIEAVAAARRHTCVGVVDPEGGMWRDVSEALAAGGLRDADVVFEFTRPEAAPGNVAALLEAGRRVVCGTTGWAADAAEIERALERGGGALLVAPNFSLGMNLFYGVVREAARRFLGTGAYEPFVVEWHHRGKRDCPSGTARKLAELVAGTAAARQVVHGEARPLPPGAVHVVGVRAGHEPGRHTVGFDSEHDVVELSHRSRGRSGFAWGAVLAGEWLAQERSGRFSFADVLEDLLSSGGER